MRRVLVGSLSLVLAISLAGGLLVWHFSGNVTTAAVDDHLVDPDTTPTGALNVLFIGSDSRDLRESSYGDADGTRRSDALMLVHFAADNSRIDAVQIPRDTLLDLPSCEDDEHGSTPGGLGMINSALQYGQACSVRAVEALSGVHVDHFVELDFDGFVDMVDALGGVDVCLAEPLRDELAHLDLPAGEQDIDGTDALALARTRHAVGDGSDISRMGHQQLLMSAIVHRVTSTSILTKPNRLLKFIDAATSSVTVDEGLSSTRAMTGLAQRAREIGEDRITFIAMPSAAAPSDPNRVVATEAASAVFDSIAADEPVRLASTDDSGTTSGPSEKIGVSVVNAAGVEGLASSATTQLEALDYLVGEPGTAAEPAESTQLVIDASPEARATAEKILEDFGLDAEIVEDPTVGGVRLVLGGDLAQAGLEPASTPPVEATARTADTALCD